MVIKDGWKLIIPYTIRSTVINAMYDLNTDPHEMNNLLGSNPDRALYQDKAEELRACLLEWLDERNSIHYYSVSQRDLINGGKPTGNNAAFVSQEVPELKPGDPISVSITMKNTGTSAWTPRGLFRLGSRGPADNEFWGLKRVELSEGDSIVPGAEKTFTFDVTVPEADGVYNFQWQMVQEGEEWFGEKTEIKQVISGNPGSYLDDCDSQTGWKSHATLSLNTADHQQGNACLEFNSSATDEFKKAFTTPYDAKGTLANTELRFWYYVSDVSKLNPSKHQVELGSGGKNDADEFNWKMTDLSNGWNYVTLKTSQAGTTGSPNVNSINWFRIYTEKTDVVTIRIDAIQVIDPTVGPVYTLLVNDGSGGGNYTGGETVSITANAAPSGKKFDHWIIESGNPTIADINASTTTLTLGESSAVISASYMDNVSVESINTHQHAIRIFPNPASEEFSIAFNAAEQSDVDISLLDLAGRMIGNGIKVLGLEPGYSVVKLPVSGIMPGTYFVSVRMNDSLYTKLVILQ